MRARRREHVDLLASERAPCGRTAEHALLALQRAAGNRAVAELVGRAGQQPVIQRKMFVDGSATDLSALFGLLGAATGHTYGRDAKTKAVSIKTSKPKPKSPLLAGKVKTVVDHPTQDAELSLGRVSQGTQFGAFPFSEFSHKEPHLVQDLRIDHFVALEKDVPGAGVAKLAHEIDENFTAHSAKVRPMDDEKAAFELAHGAALLTERDVSGEVDASRGAKPGGLRRNTFYYVAGKEPRQYRQTIEDRENDFLTYRMSFGSGAISHGSRQPRVHVASERVGGFSFHEKGSLPAVAYTIAEKVAAQLKADPTISVKLEGHCGFFDAAKNVKTGYWWALDMQELIKKTADDMVGVADMRFYSTGVSDTERTRHVEISLDRPDKVP